MHIPDGYLSPQTWVPLYGASTVFWAIALKKLKKELSAKHIPYIAMAAAFSFIIQMFNIPIPGGTTGHAVGAGIIAVLLGPWTAVLAVSVVLVIQALVFGDGGITAIGANAFNMAVVMPFVSWWVFNIVKGDAREGKRVAFAAFLSGYAGLTAAAVATAVQFGIQPSIASGPDGLPLYAPYPLSVALPVMAVEHLLLFSILEGGVTMLLFRYFQKSEASSLPVEGKLMTGFQKKLLIGLLILAVLTPLGILLPEWFGAGDAWGEWGSQTLQKLLGFVPEGLKRYADIWHAPVPDYSFGGESAGKASQIVSYIASAIIGIFLAGAVIAGLARLLSERKNPAGARFIRFLDKGIGHLAHVMKTGYDQWELSSRQGFFQKIDARVKVVFLLAFVIIVNVRNNVIAGVALTVFIFCLALLSRLNLRDLYKRVFFFTFLFGFLLAMPSMLNIFNRGEVVLALVRFARPYQIWIYHLPQVIGITAEGIRGTAVLCLRVFCSLSISFLVLYTTPLTEMIRALKLFKVPDTVIIMITLSYKYIFIFARTVEEMHLAKKSRLIRGSRERDLRHWVAGRMAFVFRKTQLRCEEVFKAMLARGFADDVKLYGFRKFGVRDWISGIALCAAGVLLLMI